MNQAIKNVFLIVAGNILDYYDFMLFAHLSSVVTRIFIPQLSLLHNQLISLLLFALPFLLRPVGGYFFGKLSDRTGRANALGKTLQYASFASLGIALLPEYEIGGILSMIIFIALRAFQGFSLGGEYMTAGTYLIERYRSHRGLLSGILGGSGSIGSLLAFSFAWFYLNDYLPESAWRWGFAIGGIITYFSYILRNRLNTSRLTDIPESRQSALFITYRSACLLTFFTGSLVGASLWTPIIYVNFYLTSFLNYPTSIGSQVTGMAILGTIIFPPLLGALSDKLPRHEIMMLLGAVLVIPFSIVGFYFLKIHPFIGQFFFILAAVVFPAPMHAVLNNLFPSGIRGRSVNTYFMIGSSIGSLLPVISGYALNRYGIEKIPLWIVSCLSIITFMLFLNLHKKFRG